MDFGVGVNNSVFIAPYFYWILGKNENSFFGGGEITFWGRNFNPDFVIHVGK